MLIPGDLTKLSKTFNSGTMLFHEGDQSEELYILLSGEIEVIKNAQIVARINENGVFFGELAAILGLPRTATARTTRKSKLVVIPSANFRKVITRSPDIALKLIILLSKRLKDTTETVAELLQSQKKSTPSEQEQKNAKKFQRHKFVRISTNMLYDKFSTEDLASFLKQMIYRILIEKNKKNFIFAQRDLADLNKKIENALKEYSDSNKRRELDLIMKEYSVKEEFLDLIKEKYKEFLPDENIKIILEDE